jgi:serine/threonine protein phosphatase PrpC
MTAFESNQQIDAIIEDILSSIDVINTIVNTNDDTIIVNRYQEIGESLVNRFQATENIIENIIENGDEVHQEVQEVVPVDLFAQAAHEFMSHQYDPTPYFESVEKQLGSGQDFAYVTKADEYTGGMVCDGHGLSGCINVIRSMNMTEILSSAEPIQTMHDILESMGPLIHLQSGSTAVYAKIFDDHVDCGSIGDSSIIIFVNGHVVWQNKPHNYSNPSEMARLCGKCVAKRDWCPKMISETELVMVPSPRITFNDTRVILVPTQSLGHRNATGFAPEIHRVDFVHGDLVRVVLFSDGVSDMLCDTLPNDTTSLLTMSAVEIAQRAETRWRKMWDCVADYRDIANSARKPTQFPPNGYDDVSVAVIQNYWGAKPPL